jgi:hypothetical protein
MLARKPVPLDLDPELLDHHERRRSRLPLAPQRPGKARLKLARPPVSGTRPAAHHVIQLELGLA